MERVVLDSRMGKTQIGVRAHRLANQSRPTLRIVAIGLAGIISAAFSWPLAEAQTWPERTTFEVKGLLSERITTVTAPNAVTASFQDGVAPNNAYNGTRDTKIKSDEPTTIFGSDTELEVDGDPDRSVILKWNVSSLPPGSSVHSASITLEVTNASTDSYEIYEMKQDWVEGEADWSQYRSGNTWQTAGAGGSPDRGTDVLGAVNATDTGSITILLDTTVHRLIEGWIDNPSINNGFILQDYTNAADGADFDSREVTSASSRPKLTVTYTSGAVTEIGMFVVLISVDGLRPDAVSSLGPGLLPNFFRFRSAGAWSDNARADFDYTVTLPNHVTMLTSRQVAAEHGHNWTSNSDPTPEETIHSNKGSYVASSLDVAHDNGLRTGVYVSKEKFVLFDKSFDAAHGMPDTTGIDNGMSKIDDYQFDSDTGVLTADFISAMQAHPFNLSFLHLRDPDSEGHSTGWMGGDYLDAVKDVDALLGDLFDLVENSPTLDTSTVLILTSDHGGTGTGHSDPSRPANYAVPFYVWGAGVADGADLYTLNVGNRLDPGTSRPTYGVSPPPIRNGDAANLLLSLLGLPGVPGSTINASQSLAVAGTGTQLPIASFTVMPVSGDAPLDVSFNASASSDVDGTITRYEWDFGDGNSGSGVVTSHTYTAARLYAATLMVTDDFGATGKATEIITVTAPNAVTASFQDGVAPNNAYNGTRDTKIKSDEPSTVFGSDTELEVDGDPDRSVILKWDLSSLPPGSSVLSASITLEVTNESSDSYEIYEMKQDWVEDEANWSQYRSGNSWQTAGAGGTPDRGTDVLGVVNATDTGSITILLDTTVHRLIESWIDNPSINKGFILQDYPYADNGADFDSREVTSASSRPKLTVTYLSDVDMAVEGAREIPSALVLSANYPNPFHSTTTLRFDLPARAWVNLEVVDLLGRTVAMLVDGPMAAGEQTVVFDGRGLSSGVYLARLRAEAVTKEIRMGCAVSSVGSFRQAGIS